jgi:selenocysteine lyase/cysteine desulfurase
MLNRRAFLGAVAAPAVLPAVLPGGLAPRPRRFGLEALAELARTPGSPEELARDEDFWFAVQRAFTTDRSLVNLNNGGVSPAPDVVQEAHARFLAHANDAPAYVMWRLQEPQKETVRAGLADLFGCDAEEVAITRNASEGLEICQLGIDLEPGDQVLTSNQDYPRMLATFRQRERRDGIELVEVELPVPCEDPAEVVRRFEAAITDKTRMILCCHVINLTGQVLPVKEIAALGRRRGIPVVVDGAHAFAHLVFRRDDLDCDYYATSLHKWLFAPIGTGFLYVRKERIPDLWPMMAAPEERTADIRKFEEIGTHPVPTPLAIGQALAFHDGLGAERKLARMIWLRDRWARRLVRHDRVRLNTSLAPGFAGGIANVRIDGVDTLELANHLWNAHRIFVVAIQHPAVDGIRVSPSVYTTPHEIDRFAQAMEDVIENGLPA